MVPMTSDNCTSNSGTTRALWYCPTAAAASLALMPE